MMILLEYMALRKLLHCLDCYFPSVCQKNTHGKNNFRQLLTESTLFALIAPEGLFLLGQPADSYTDSQKVLGHLVYTCYLLEK